MTVAQQTWNELVALCSAQEGNARVVIKPPQFLCVRSPRKTSRRCWSRLLQSQYLPLLNIGGRRIQLQPEPMAPGPRGRVRLCLVLANESVSRCFLPSLVEDVIAGLCDQPQEEVLLEISLLDSMCGRFSCVGRS